MLLIRFCNRLKRKFNQRQLFFYFLFFMVYCAYSHLVYAACTGVACSCSVGTSAVAFGNYNPTLGTATTATGNVAVTCSALVLGIISYVISMNAGNSGSFAARFMNLTGNHLNYNLYTQVGHTTIWGNGTGATVTVSDSYLLILGPNLNNYTVYGLLPALQTIPAGAYTDTITVTVTY
ncbi:MAG: spore coat U domain-containing protein [Pseudomonadota bacterium]